MDDKKFENGPEMFRMSGEVSPAPALEKSPSGADNFEKSMENGVPPFAGEEFGVASPDNNYYGESADDGKNEVENNYNEGVSDAARLIDYGLDAATKQFGVEGVVQRIKGFDVSGSMNPIGDFLKELGVNTREERKELREENEAEKVSREEFRENMDVEQQKKSIEGALKAIADMKELIAEVEDADPRYEELRENAKRAGMGYFEYAVKEYGTRNLSKLFESLNAQREKKEEESEPKEEVQAENGLNQEIFDK